MQAFRSGGTIAFNELGQWRQWFWGQLIFMVDGRGVLSVSSVHVLCFVFCDRNLACFLILGKWRELWMRASQKIKIWIRNE